MAAPARPTNETANLLDAESGEPLLIGSQQIPLPSQFENKTTRLFGFALSDDSISLDDDYEQNVRLCQHGSMATLGGAA